jgi:hypothetical protein
MLKVVKKKTLNGFDLDRTPSLYSIHFKNAIHYKIAIPYYTNSLGYIRSQQLVNNIQSMVRKKRKETVNVYVESGKKKTLNWFDLVQTLLNFHLPLPCQRQFWI